MATLGAALIGCGRMGRSLAEAFVATGRGRIVAAVDPRAEAAEEVAGKYGAAALSSLDEALERDEVEAVIIATPNALHAPQAVQAARAGRHVFVEKPMALNAQQCREMIEAARGAGVKLMVGQVLRYIVPFVWMIEQVREGAWGEPFAAQVVRISSGWSGTVWAETGWRFRADMTGGPLLEVSVHEIDFLRQAMMAEVETVWAKVGRFRLDEIDYYDTAQVLMTFEGGRPAQLFAGHCAIQGRHAGVLCCTEATCSWGLGRNVLLNLASGETLEISAAELREKYEGGVQREIREFIEAVLDDRPVTIPGEEGLRNVQIAEAAVLSSQEGRPVAPSEL